MALPTPETQAAEPGLAEYLSWQAPGAPASVKVRLDVVTAMTGEVIEGFSALRRRGVEVGGFLVGRRENATIFIDRYERVSCEYRFGPSYILSDEEKARFQETWSRLGSDEKLSIVGFYRSHTRKDLQLEQSDLEIIQRWFNDATSIFLVVKPLDITHLVAEFFFRENGVLPMRSAGREFAFRGTGEGTFADVPHAVTPHTVTPQAVSTRPAELPTVPVNPIPRDEIATTKVSEPPPVPQFLRPATEQTPKHSFFGRYWEALTACLLVLCAAGLFWWQHSGDNESDASERAAPAAAAASPTPPKPAPVNSDVPVPVSLGLEVRPTPGAWRVMWKRDLPVIQNARRGVLAINDGAQRKQVELDQSQLRAGTISYRPSSDDVSFHLEVFGPDNQSSNESFRVLLATKPNKPLAPAAATTPSPVQKLPEPVQKLPEKLAAAASSPHAVEKSTIPDRGPTPGQARDQTVSQEPGRRQIPDLPQPSLSPPPPRLAPAEVVARVRPVITEGIRSRITRDVVVLVKVMIDASGRVTGAIPVSRGNGLSSYLAKRASEAALKWRFRPARENNRPVPSSQVIRFVFEK